MGIAGGCWGVLGMQKGGIRKRQRLQDGQGKWLRWLVNVLKEAMLEWYHPESSCRGEEQRRSKDGLGRLSGRKQPKKTWS